MSSLWAAAGSPGRSRCLALLALAPVLVNGLACDIGTALLGGEGLACDRDQACPADLVCLQGRCRASAAADAGLVDAWLAETGGADGQGADRASGPDHDPPADAGVAEGPRPEVGLDSAGLDSAEPDSAGLDSAGLDSGSMDGGDAGSRPDSAAPDTSPLDAALPDLGIGDVGSLPRLLEPGAEHTCALLSNGRVKCFGQNQDGQLGLGDVSSRGDGAGEMGDDLAPVPLGPLSAIDVAAGYRHSCAVRVDGQVVCWGDNWAGQLGLGHTATVGEEAGDVLTGLWPLDLGPSARAETVAVGGAHSCALLEGGQVKCWGSNMDGQLGLGDRQRRGDQVGEMGQALEPVDLGSGVVATAISLGQNHTCALTQGGDVKCWGSNLLGQLGLGQEVDDWGIASNQMGADLPSVNLGLNEYASAIAAGGWHTCALLLGGRIKCWGQNNAGQLGQGDTTNRGRLSSQMGPGLPYIDLGPGRTAQQLAAGWMHNCALLDGPAVKCWGYNISGQLGLGDVAERGILSTQMGDALPELNLGGAGPAQALSADGYHSCAILDDGSAKCWGANGDGQLGLGDIFARGDGAGEMGDNLQSIDFGS